MKILVTGGAGFIGSHTSDKLLAQGHDVRVLDILKAPVHPKGEVPEYLDPRIEFIKGDVRNEDILLHAMQGCDAIYHLAAFQDYLPVFSQYFDVNVTSTALIYELIVRDKLPIKKVVVASSQATLGEGLYHDANGKPVLPDIRTNEQLEQGLWDIQPVGDQAGPLAWQRTDETVANPQNQYGISKIGQEKVALHLGKRYNIPTTAMRYSIVQGPRQSFYNAYSGACRVFCLSFHQGKPPAVYEDGEQVRDFVNIHDVVDANVMMLEDDRSNYEMYNVGGDKPLTVKQFAEVVGEVYGAKDYKAEASGKYRFGDTRHICSDVSKLKALGWKPQRDVYASVEAYKAWLDAVPADEVANILGFCSKAMEQMDVVREVKQ